MMVAAVRSFLFLIVFYGITLVAVPLAFPVALLGQKALLRHVRWWVSAHHWCCRWILGIRIRIEGVVPVGPVLVAAKHQADFEPIELLGILDMPAVIMKRQLDTIPLFGRVTRRYGAIAIDRSGGATALRTMMRAANEAAAQGRSILIFPEGTRVEPGARPELQSGFAGLYRLLGLPVVPIALDSGHLWPRRGIVRRSGVVTMRFGDPIPPGLPRAEIERRVHAAINLLESER